MKVGWVYSPAIHVKKRVGDYTHPTKACTTKYARIQMPDEIAKLKSQLEEHAQLIRATESLLPKVALVAEKICQAFGNGNRLYTMGNGGSAADALHFAEELLGRYKRDRKPLPASSFVADPTGLTCISNDYGWENVFVRQVQGLVKPGDIVVGISTSGNSENVLRAMKAAKEQNAFTVAFTGATGGKIAPLADHLLNVPSTATARIQEMHIFMIHLLCESIDDWVLGE
jgi:D-sedoheptulose 7-phosphate isomerase